MIARHDLRVGAILARGGLIALAIVASVACVALVRRDTTPLVFAYGGIGAYLVIRRPTNSIGWLLVVFASGLALNGVRVTADLTELQAGRADPLGAATR